MSIQLQDYRWPAEWELHEATWVSWPVNENTWPGIFERIPAAYARFVAAIAHFEPVRVLIHGDHAVEQAKRLLLDACEQSGSSFPVEIVDIPVNDSWCRDHGPLFLNRRPDADPVTPASIIIDWDYNAWGGKYPPWDNDALVASRVADHLGIPSVRPDIILEGGAIEGDGNGTILTTDSCLLNPNRNPQLDRQEMESALRNYLQIKHVVWLPGQGILGDDTDGHIDQVARFVDSRQVIVAAPYSEDAPEANDLLANQLAVDDAHNAAGQPLHAVPLKLPTPRFQQEHRLPASYCNYYLVNGGVIVPTFRDDHDDNAIQVICGCFPDRTVVAVDALDLVWGLGAFHCMTQQQPAN